MNEALEQLAREAGAPEEALQQLWFVVFVQQFADRLLTVVEQECME
jgi:hypothetical protein